MPTLPDLDTSSVGMVAYWNAIDDGGVGEIDPTDVIDAGVVNSFEQYDNGVEGTLEVPYTETVSADRGLAAVTTELTWRVKNDGWFVVYTDRNNVYGSDIANDNCQGYVFSLWDWTHTGFSFDTLSPNHNAPPVTVYSESIRSLQSNLSVNPTFNHSDTGIYNYEYPNATTLEIAWERDTAGNTPRGLTGTISYSSVTDRKFHSMGTLIIDNDEANDVTFEGTLVASNNADIGAIDILGKGLMPDAGTSYQQNGGATFNNSDYGTLGWHTMMYA